MPTKTPKRVAPSRSKGRKRLIALHDYVKAQSEDRHWRKFFRMRNWFETIPGVTKIDQNWKRGTPVQVNNECGTAGCLLGHAPNVPALKRLGLEAVFVKWLTEEKKQKPNFGFRFDDQIYSAYASRNTPLDLAEKLFGISEIRVWHIFGNGESHDRDLARMTPARALRDLMRAVDQIDKNERWEF